jgi:polysaccharide pyruvyl transferase WcaK-like protein
LAVLFPTADLDFTREVQRRLLSASDIIVSPNAHDLLHLCDTAVMTVAGRYHMAVAGVASRSQMIALAYDPKLLHLAASLGFDAIAPDAPAEAAARLVIGRGTQSVAESAVERLASVREDRILRLQMALAGPAQ